MTDVTVLSLILGSATSFVGLMLAVRSFITHSQKKAVADAQEKRDIQELKERVDKLEKKMEGKHNE